MLIRIAMDLGDAALLVHPDQGRRDPSEGARDHARLGRPQRPGARGRLDPQRLSPAWARSGSASRGGRTPGGAATSTRRASSQRRELEYAAERLTSIEINGSFYSLQRPTSYAAWREQTPDDFVFAVKGGRYITHLKRLARRRDAAGELLRLRRARARAQARADPVAAARRTCAFDADRLAAFFAQLPRTTTAAAALAQRHDDKVPEDRALTSRPRRDRPLRHALEFRSPTFATPEATARCCASTTSPACSPTPRASGRGSTRTPADFRYVRLHGDAELYASGYTDARARRVGRARAGAGPTTAATCSSTSTTTSRGTRRTTRWRCRNDWASPRRPRRPSGGPRSCAGT